MTRSVRTIAWIGAAVVVLAVAFVRVTRPSPIEADLATVTRGSLVVTIEEEGRTRVRQRYVVSTPAAGTLDRVSFRPGDRVVRGAVVATMRPALAAPLDVRSTTQLRARAEAARDELGRARAARDAARAELEYAQADATRAAQLNAAGISSTADRERAGTRLRTAQQQWEAADATIRVAEHSVQEAEAGLLAPREAPRGSSITLRAPVNGTVLRIFEESERTLAAGAPIIELGDPASLEIVVDLLSSDAVKVQPGTRARLHRWGGDATLDAIVRSVEPSTFTKVSALGVEEQRVNVLLDFDCATRPPLGDGYSVDVQIVVDERKDVVRVPTGALVRAGDEWAVYVIDESDRARWRLVTLGARAAFEVECLSGLEAGEQIVLYPGDRVSDGTRVRVSLPAAR
jgi:HlyD family secretion protein